ncbi:YbgA family protein [Haliea sp. E17]|uniref:YbgA family protein n=1 Tax=Haliea sp. E17 TaxID=3401576 RepID=UPI003AAFE1E8
MSTTSSSERPVIGIGACLAGNPVRYNGQTKSANAHVRALADHFELRPFCPEMSAGLGVPRPPIHLVGETDAIRVLDVDTHAHDYTDALRDCARRFLDANTGVCGYILVKGSPSCGFDRVKRFNAAGNLVARDAQGMYASTLAELDPLLPLEDDERLNDPGLRESFVTRALTYHDWQQLCAQGLNAGRLVAFYSRYKYLVMAHDVPAYRHLGQMLADAGKHDPQVLGATFIRELMQALRRRATRRSHSNVLFHIAGYLKRRVQGEERQRLAGLIEQYRRGEVPLVVPVTMLKHHFANHPDAYIDNQVFLYPYPDELGLRNSL